jgi:hypothetical protein
MKVNNSAFTVYNNSKEVNAKNNTLNIVDSEVDQRTHNKETLSNVKEIGSAQWDRHSLWSDAMTATINAEFSVSKGFFNDPTLNSDKKIQCFGEYQIAHQKINNYRSEIYSNLNKARTEVLSLKYYRSSISEGKLGSSVEENAIAIRIEQNSKITDENEKLFLKIDEEIVTYKVRIKDISTKDYPTLNICSEIATLAQAVPKSIPKANTQELLIKKDVTPTYVEDKSINKVNGFKFNSMVNRDNLNNLDKELFDLVGRIGTELNVDINDSKNIEVIKEKSFNIAKTIHKNIIDNKLLSNEQLKKMDRVSFMFASSLNGSSSTWTQWVNDNIHDVDIEGYKSEISKYLSFINTAYLNGVDEIRMDGGFRESVGAVFYGSSVADRTVGSSLLKLKEQYGLINSDAALNILQSLIVNQIKQRTPNISDVQIKLNAKLPQYQTDDFYAAYRGINQSKLNLNYIDKVEGRISTKEAIAYLLKSFIDIDGIKTLRGNNKLDISPDSLFAHQKDNINDLVKRLGHVQRAGNRNNRDIAIDKDDQMPDRGVCAHGTFNQIIEVGNLKHRNIRIISEAKTLFDDKWNKITNKYWSEVPDEQKEHLQDLFKENVDIKIHKTDQAYYIKNNSVNIDRSYNEFIMNIIRDMDDDFNFFNSKSPYYLGININALEANINNLQYF